MASKIVIHQDVTTQTGTLDDAVIAELVTLTNFSNAGVAAWRWTMLYKPTGSAATLTTPTSSSATFMPDVPGTYLVQLRTFTDAAANELDASDTQALGVPYEGSFTWRIPAAGETTQFGGEGWAVEVNKILGEIRQALVDGSGGGIVIPSPQNGDIIRHVAGTWARLPVGNPGSVLSVNGSDLPAWAEPFGSAASHIVSIASAQMGSPIPITTGSSNTTLTTEDIESDVVPCVRLTIEDMVGGYYFRVNPAVDLPDRFTIALGFSASGAVSGPPIIGVGLVEAAGAIDEVHFLSFAYLGGSKTVGFQAVAGATVEYFHKAAPTLTTEFYVELDIEAKNIEAVVTSPQVEMSASFYGNANIVGGDPYTTEVDRNAVVLDAVVLNATESARTVMRTASHPDPWDASWDTLNMKHIAFSIFTTPDPLTAVFDIRDFRILKHPKDR